MKVVLVHDNDGQPRGVEQVFATEVAHLEGHSHQVTCYMVDNEAVADMGRLALARATDSDGARFRALRDLFRRVAPDRSARPHLLAARVRRRVRRRAVRRGGCRADPARHADDLPVRAPVLRWCTVWALRYHDGRVA